MFARNIDFIVRFCYNVDRIYWGNSQISPLFPVYLGISQVITSSAAKRIAMGRWCEVRCACPNRKRIPPGTWDAPFECGHEDGMLFQTHPGDIFYMGRVIEKLLENGETFSEQFAFSTWLHLSNFTNYDDEKLALTNDQRDFWRLEIADLKRLIDDPPMLSYNDANIWSTMVKRLDNDLSSSPSEIVRDAMRLCNASEKTGNPIEFFT